MEGSLVFSLREDGPRYVYFEQWVYQKDLAYVRGASVHISSK